MITRQKEKQRTQIELISLDELVPQDHLVRKLEAAIDFTFIYDLVKDRYSEERGRPSIDPVSLFKIVLVQYLFGIRSMRQTIQEIQTNMAYRWFIGYGLNEEIPHFTTFGKNYVRRFKDTDIFEQVFERILEEVIKAGFLKPEEVFIDATHVKASANKGKYRKEIIEKSVRHYQDQLEAEVNKDRSNHGKGPLKESKKKTELKEQKVSTTDPDSGILRKSEKEKCFAYSYHTACDPNGFILGLTVTGANVHDSTMLEEILRQVTERVGTPESVAVDAGYKTPFICKTLIDRKIRPVMPYKRPMTKKGFFRKHEYVYDEYYDCYLCPGDKILTYRTTNREGYREYHSNPSDCETCPHRSQCTESRDHTKRLMRHVWQDYLDEAEHLRHTTQNKTIYEKRKETIERVFADMKEKHGMRWTTLRGIRRVATEAMLVAAAMNLKKLATWKWRRGLTGPDPSSCKRKMALELKKCWLLFRRPAFLSSV